MIYSKFSMTLDIALLPFGAPNLGETPREDVAGQRDWWAEQGASDARRRITLR